MHVVILGNGIAGTTAARHLRKRDDQVKITMVSGESDHHWSRPALMYIYMGHMRYRDTKPYEDDFWPRNRIMLRRGWVVGLDPTQRTLLFADGSKLTYDRLILATGSVPNRFGWPGQALRRVQGMYSLQDLVRLEQASPEVSRAVVVGGGLIGVELAEMLHSRGKHVTIFAREARYWDHVLPPQEADMVGREIREAGIDLRLSTELAEIVDDGTGAVGSVRTTSGEALPCQFVGLTAGVRPRVDVAQQGGVPVGRGILVDEQLQTQVDGVYAVGDCAEIVFDSGEHAIQQVWYTGRAQGEVVAANVLGASLRYHRGIWFNSAKFFDLEYQVYGTVPSRVGGDLEHLYWEDPDARRAMRVVHRGRGGRRELDGDSRASSCV